MPTYHDKWLENAQRHGVPAETRVDIARRHGISPESFNILEKLEEIRDPDGKSFFLLPPSASGDHALSVALITYVFNAGTGYGKAGKQPPDFPETPYSAAEVQRIFNRQNANSWSYARDVRFVHRNGARLVATPNGILMGLGGNWIQRQFSQQGGTAWGDIFMVNISVPSDPVAQLRRIVRSGHIWYTDANGRPGQGAPPRGAALSTMGGQGLRAHAQGLQLGSAPREGLWESEQARRIRRSVRWGLPSGLESVNSVVEHQ
jgi:hypothetical protein